MCRFSHCVLGLFIVSAATLVSCGGTSTSTPYTRIQLRSTALLLESEFVPTVPSALKDDGVGFDTTDSSVLLLMPKSTMEDILGVRLKERNDFSFDILVHDNPKQVLARSVTSEEIRLLLENAPARSLVEIDPVVASTKLAAVERDDFRYVILRSAVDGVADATNSTFVAECVAFRKYVTSAGADTCHRDFFIASSLKVAVSFPDRLVGHAEAIEAGVRCVVDVWHRRAQTPTVSIDIDTCYAKKVISR